MGLNQVRMRIGLAAALVVGLAGFTFSGDDRVQVTAYFEQFKGIYAGDAVTVRGVPVGEVTDVTPDAEQVKVEFELDADVKIPDDVNAVVVAESVVSVRSIALGPVPGDGAPLKNNAVIPVSRTAVPIEWDQIKDQLVDLSTALGPNGANKRGATGALVSASADFLNGQGASLNSTIRDVSEAMSTLSDNGGALFSTVRNMQVFISALKGSDVQMRYFNQRLATVADSLAQDRDVLVGALGGLNRAFKEVDNFLRANRNITVSTLKELRSTTSLLSENRQQIADLLQVAPTGLSNFYAILDPRGGSVGPALTGALTLNNLRTPAQVICGALLAMGGDRSACQAAIGPLAQYLALNAPPVGAPLVQHNGAGSGGTVEPGDTSRSGGSAPADAGTNLLSQLFGGQ